MPNARVDFREPWRSGAAPCRSALFVFGWKPGIDRLIRVGADLEVGAMMIGVAAVFIEAMGPHELDHLQGAFLAVDVRNGDIGFLFLIERCHVHEQAVG